MGFTQGASHPEGWDEAPALRSAFRATKTPKPRTLGDPRVRGFVVFLPNSRNRGGSVASVVRRTGPVRRFTRPTRVLSPGPPLRCSWVEVGIVKLLNRLIEILLHIVYGGGALLSFAFLILMLVAIANMLIHKVIAWL